METKDLAIAALIAGGAYLIFKGSGEEATVPGGSGGGGYSLDFSGLTDAFQSQNLLNASMLSGYISQARNNAGGMVSSGGDYTGIFSMLLDRAKTAEDALKKKADDPFGLNASMDYSLLLKNLLRGAKEGLKLPGQDSSTEDAGFLNSNRWPQAANDFGNNIGTALAALPAAMVEGGRTGLGGSPGGRVFTAAATGAAVGSIIPVAGTIGGGLVGGGTGIFNELVLMFSGGGLGFRAPGSDYLGRPNYGTSSGPSTIFVPAPLFSSTGKGFSAPAYTVTSSPSTMRANSTAAGTPGINYSSRGGGISSGSNQNFTPLNYSPTPSRKWGAIGSSAKGGVIYGWVN